MSEFWFGFLVAWGIVSPALAIFGYYYFVTESNFKKLKEQLGRTPEVLDADQQAVLAEADKIISENEGKGKDAV